MIFTLKTKGKICKHIFIFYLFELVLGLNLKKVKDIVQVQVQQRSSQIFKLLTVDFKVACLQPDGSLL